MQEIMCVPFVLWQQIVTVLLQQSSRKLVWSSLTYLCVRVCMCLCTQQLHPTVASVGGMVAWWLVLLHLQTFFSGILQTNRWRPRLKPPFIGNTEIHRSKQHTYRGLFKKKRKKKKTRKNLVERV